MVEVDDVCAYMWPDHAPTPGQRDQAAQALSMALAVVANYTRDRHLDAQGNPRTGVETVIMTVACRMLANPGQVSTSRSAGVFSENLGKGFQGLTLGEQIILDRWRTRSVHG